MALSPQQQEMIKFPSFKEMERVSHKNFKCIYPKRVVYKDGSIRYERCKQRVNQKDRNCAEVIRKEITPTRLEAEELRARLTDIAELCCCLVAKGHRFYARCIGRLDSAAIQWMTEMEYDVASLAPFRLSRFIEYIATSEREDLKTLVPAKLQKKEDETGTLYLLENPDDSGLVKIGITMARGNARFESFETKCGFTPRVIEQICQVPCVKRVEALILAEFASHRMSNTSCVMNWDCGALHSEWLQITPEIVSEAMEKWTFWMYEARPYDVLSEDAQTSGCLSVEWNRDLLALEKKDLLFDSNNIFRRWELKKAQNLRTQTLSASLDGLQIRERPIHCVYKGVVKVPEDDRPEVPVAEAPPG